MSSSASSDDKGLLAPLCDLSRAYFVIWTTTPWTLPGNMAIALHPREDYVLVRAADGDCYITASALCAKTMQAGGLDSYEELAHYFRRRVGVYDTAAPSRSSSATA